MKSIHHHHHHHRTPPFSTLSHQHAPRGSVLQRHNFYSPPNSVRTKATVITTSHLVVLSVTSPPATTGDLKVLIPTSLGFLFLYYIANFVVPAMVIKDLEKDDASKDQNPNDEERFN